MIPVSHTLGAARQAFKGKANEMIAEHLIQSHVMRKPPQARLRLLAQLMIELAHQWVAQTAIGDDRDSLGGEAMIRNAAEVVTAVRLFFPDVTEPRSDTQNMIRFVRESLTSQLDCHAERMLCEVIGDIQSSDRTDGTTASASNHDQVQFEEEEWSRLFHQEMTNGRGRITLCADQAEDDELDDLPF